MYFRIMSIIFICVSFLLSSCAPKHSDIVVAKYGQEKITLGEFENVYVKNAGSIDAAKKDSIDRLKSFLDLYVNFKMKLRDAEVRGYKKNPAMDAELKDYKDKVGTSYLIDKEVVEPGIKDLYAKRKYELRVSHLMLRPDTLSDEKTRELARSLIDRIHKGEKFEDLVNKYSADFYSKKDGGDIYYITGGMIVPEFEDAAFETNVGSIYPEPVKTRFGYHIVKVTEKKERTPQIRASHILVGVKKDSTKVDTVAALALIKNIKQQLDNGADFAELAKKYSEDPSTKQNGGDLGYFERRQMVKEFDDAAFKLNVGQVSDIIKSQFGYHLIKLTDKTAYPSFEEEKDNLKKIFQKTRYEQAYSDYLKKLKNQFNFKLNQNVLNAISAHAVDSARFSTSYWNCKWRNSLKDSTVFSINNNKVILDSLISDIQKIPEFDNRYINNQTITNAVNKNADNKALALKVNELDGTDPQFTSLMDEYRNGIYVFRLQEEEVWDKIKTDSAKMLDFYSEKINLMNNPGKANDPEVKELKANLTWPDRVSFIEIYAKSDSLINVYYSQLEKGADFKEMAAKNIGRADLKDKAGIYTLVGVNTVEQSKVAFSLPEVGAFSKPFKAANGYSIVKLTEKSPARVKTYEEAKAEISRLYQEAEAKRLEDNYVSTLRGIYKPEIYYNKVEEAFKSN